MLLLSIQVVKHSAKLSTKLMAPPSSKMKSNRQKKRQRESKKHKKKEAPQAPPAPIDQPAFLGTVRATILDLVNGGVQKINYSNLQTQVMSGFQFSSPTERALAIEDFNKCIEVLLWEKPPALIINSGRETTCEFRL